MDGDEETPLSIVRMCKIGVLPSRALDMSGSMYVTITYLLRGECGGLGVIVSWLVG